MRRLLLGLGLIAAPLAAQQKLDRRIAIASDASIRITNLTGATRVLGWDRDSIAVSGSAPATAGFFMGGSGRMAKLGLEPEEGVKDVNSSYLDVRVPRHARVWVRSAAGAIDVQALQGEVDLVSEGGTIRVTGSMRVVTAESIDGDIEVVGPIPLVRVKTGSGRILLRQPTGDVMATTVTGPIVVTEGQAQGARLETVSGAVSYGGTIEHHGTLNIQTHSGDVELLLPSMLGAEFDLQSTSAAVTAAIPAKTDQVRKGKQLFFANAGGGAQVVVRTFKGKIAVYGQ